MYQWRNRRRGDGGAVVADERTKHLAEGLRLRSEANMAVDKLAAWEAEESTLAHAEHVEQLRAEIETKRSRREKLNDMILARVHNDPNPEVTRSYQSEFRELDDDVKQLEHVLAEAQLHGPAEPEIPAHHERTDADAVERDVRARAALARSKAARGETPTPSECIALGYARACGWSR